MIFSSVYSLISGFAVEGGETKGGIAALGVDGKALVLQIITFIVVFVLLKKFALDKIVQTLEERRKTIDAGVELGREMAQEKERLDEEVEKVLKKARIEADKIIAAGHVEVGTLLKEAEEVAARRTDGLLKDAHARIDDDISKARKALEKEMLQLVAEATEAIIGEKLDSDKDNALIEKTLHGAKSL